MFILGFDHHIHLKLGYKPVFEHLFPFLTVFGFHAQNINPEVYDVLVALRQCKLGSRKFCFSPFFLGEMPPISPQSILCLHSPPFIYPGSNLFCLFAETVCLTKGAGAGTTKNFWKAYSYMLVVLSTF